MQQSKKHSEKQRFLCVSALTNVYTFFQFHHRHASILKATSSVTYATFYWNTRSEIISKTCSCLRHIAIKTHQNILCGCSCCAVSLLKWCVLKANIVPAGTNALIPTLNANKVPFPCNFPHPLPGLLSSTAISPKRLTKLTLRPPNEQMMSNI